MKMAKKLFDKYSSMSIEMKAAAWYAACNIVQKIAPWLVMIILTHYLSTKDYGVYTIFMSWLEIFEIIITLKIFSNGYVAALVRYNKQRKLYTASMQTLSIMLILIWAVIYLVFHNQIDLATGMSIKLTLMMIFSFFGTVFFGLWSSRQRVDNNYRSMVAATIAFGLLGPVVGALTVFLNFKDPVFCVIAVRTVIQFLFSIPFFLSNYRGTSSIWNKTFMVNALRYNLPLVPYYLSMTLLNHSDRLMIQQIDGFEDAALYSVSYSAAMMIFIVSGALNLSLQAWLFKQFKEDSESSQQSDTNKTKLISMGTIIVSVLVLLEIVMAPEIIFVLGGSKYLAAKWVIPPLALSVIVMFIYQQYVNILFYFKRTGVILLVSVFACLCNIGLNLFLIPKYGYIAGGYTTLASYLLVMVCYLFFARKVAISNHVVFGKYFNTRLQMLGLTASIVVSALLLIVYNWTVIRYVLTLIIIAGIFITRQKWMPLFRKGSI